MAWRRNNRLIVSVSAELLLIYGRPRGSWARHAEMLRTLEKLSWSLCCASVKVRAFCDLLPVIGTQWVNESSCCGLLVADSIPRGK